MMVKSWGDQLTTEQTNELLIRLSQKHASFIQDETIRQCLSSVDYGAIPDLCDLSVPYGTASRLACEPDANRVLYALDLYHFGQVKAFFSKRADIDLGKSTAEAALETFRSSELACRHTNDIFRLHSLGGLQFSPDVERVLHTAQRKISAILGVVPTYDEIPCRFGPGATTQLPKRMACAKAKLSQPLACSGDMSPILSKVLETIPHLIQGEISTCSVDEVYEIFIVDVEIHPGKIVTVPKNAKTDRTVMIEPSLNSMFQLGVGKIMADRMRRFGLDIKDQSINKDLARESSYSGALATLDLSSASDCISSKLVEHLLPPDWYDLLSHLRTSVCELPDGGRLRLEKFSSMGNGFTFPLETLIFWALSSSVEGCSGQTYVYGDDIIVPTKSARDVIRTLEVCGFSVNTEKSFLDGLFRESCGGDYFWAIDIRPIFIKDKLSGHDLFRLHNFYMRRGYPEFAEIVKSAIPTDVMLFGPDGYGDGHLLEDPYAPSSCSWRVRHPKHQERQWGGYLFDTYKSLSRTTAKKMRGDRVLPVYSIYLTQVEQDERPDNSHSRSGLPEWEFFDYGWNYIPTRDELIAYLERTESSRSSSKRRFAKDGTVIEDLPGTKGFKRITIYVF